MVALRAGTTVADIEDVYPLSPMQSGMLFEQLLEKAGAAYFLQFDHRIEGAFDAGRFEATWNYLFARHTILRTKFVHEQLAEPLQVVLKERRVGFAFDDLRGRPSAAQRDFIEQAKDQDRRRSFNLTDEVLMRFHVYQVEDDAFQVVWSFHHIILDGWCFGILYREFLEVYQAFSKGVAPALADATPYPATSPGCSRPMRIARKPIGVTTSAGSIRPAGFRSTAAVTPRQPRPTRTDSSNGIATRPADCSPWRRAITSRFTP